MIKDIFEAIDRIVAWLGLIGKCNDKRNAQMNAALEAVMTAANETPTYLAKRRIRKAIPRKHEYRDHDAETNLRDAWREAGTRLNQVAGDEDTSWLARCCFEKYVYWADPDHIKWEDDATVQAVQP